MKRVKELKKEIKKGALRAEKLGKNLKVARKKADDRISKITKLEREKEDLNIQKELGPAKVHSGLKHWEGKAKEFKAHMEALQKKVFEYEVLVRDVKKNERSMKKEVEQANKMRF